MISICTAAIKARSEVQTFVEALEAHNDPDSFEIVLVDDRRFDDGSQETYEYLSERYTNFGYCTHTKVDAIIWLESLLESWSERMPTEYLSQLVRNLELYKRDELFDPEKKFLWLSSGRLYNRAAELATGDTLIFTPADFLYMFSLAELEQFVNDRTVGGVFYAKPHAAWCKIKRPQRMTPSLSRTYFVHPEDSSTIPLDDPNLLPLFKDLLSAGQRHFPVSYGFHGFHVMTRQTYNTIGGFTEETYWRAVADNAMTAHGTGQMNVNLPPHIAVAWVKQLRPISQDAVYLHGDNSDIAKMFEESISLGSKPVRFPW